MDRVMRQLRREIEWEEFSSLELKRALASYRNPADKAHRLQQQTAIIRVKQGMYVFGPDYRRGPISKEILANLIYGPSYLSLEWALAYHNLIPERVHWMTSVTSKRSCRFDTPLGIFSYHHRPLSLMGAGVTMCPFDQQRQFMVATPEKALCDRLAEVRGLSTTDELLEFLEGSLRIERSDLINLNLALLVQIADLYGHPTVTLLSQTIGRFL